jgi:putative hydrolase of HD superfamily
VPGLALAQTSPSPASPASEAAVVDREVAAYNAHDAAGVAAMHDRNATLTVLPSGKVLATGNAEVQAFFTQRFIKNPTAHLALTQRNVLKNMVISHYALSGVPGVPEIVAMYEVENGLITSEWLIYG